MSQRIADLESYYLIQDQTVREVFRQAYENQRVLQTQVDDLKRLIRDSPDLPTLQNSLQNEE